MTDTEFTKYLISTYDFSRPASFDFMGLFWVVAFLLVMSFIAYSFRSE